MFECEVPKASFSCKCKQVNVTFDINMGRSRVHCCCCDCYQKHEWAASLGGPKIPDIIAKHERPMLLEHWDGRMTVTGKEHLTFNKLHANSLSTNCVAKCCHTVLFVDNPFYQGNVVLLFPDMIELHNAQHRDGIVGTSWIRDWPEHLQANIDMTKPCWFRGEDDQLTGIGDWPAAVTFMMREVFGVPPVGEGQSFAELLEEVGRGEVENLGFEPRVHH
jgi:hypothetical protein